MRGGNLILHDLVFPFQLYAIRNVDMDCVWRMIHVVVTLDTKGNSVLNQVCHTALHVQWSCVQYSHVYCIQYSAVNAMWSMYVQNT